jgi:hypothetical protein
MLKAFGLSHTMVTVNDEARTVTLRKKGSRKNDLTNQVVLKPLRPGAAEWTAAVGGVVRVIRTIPEARALVFQINEHWKPIESVLTARPS